MTRQRAPEISARTLCICPTCKGKGVNPDHHPASLALSDCCPGCNGLGRIDETLGPVPLEQIVEFFRNQLIQQKRSYKKDREALAKINAAFEVLAEISNRPHPATVTHSRGHLGAAKAD